MKEEGVKVGNDRFQAVLHSSGAREVGRAWTVVVLIIDNPLLFSISCIFLLVLEFSTLSFCRFSM